MFKHPNTIVAVTGDPKATMQFDRYEKLIVVAKGVELVNWPATVPFVNASEISSIHTLQHLHSTLTHNNVDQRCHWVTLSEEEWNRCKTLYYDAEAIPQKRKQKAWEDEPISSGSQCSESKMDDQDMGVAGPSKKKMQADGVWKGE